MPDNGTDARAMYAARAARAYAAMQRRFRTTTGLYRRNGRLHLRRTPAHLWPFSRALVATLDLAGIDPALTSGFDAEVEIADRLATLSRYWDPDRAPPAYSSDVRGARVARDRYYDDNAWVGLALIQLERLSPRAGNLRRAQQVFQFAVSGWSQLERPLPGGVFWVEQGHGTGARNHDRNAVSNAPNAQVGLHLEQLQGVPPDTHGSAGARDMYEWVMSALDSSRATERPGTGLFWDKIRGDGSIDETFWSYNQGSMVGASVLLARLEPDSHSDYLARAEAIARKAMRYFTAVGYEHQPPAFNAIFFRNLMQLHVATRDEQLRVEIIEAIRAYADRAWQQRRDRPRVFGRKATLLDESAIVQVLALLAWEENEYDRLA